MSTVGRNDPCTCGSGRKYKSCHLRPFYPQDYFKAEIRSFEIINRIQYRVPETIQILDSVIIAEDPKPWDQELIQLLKPLHEIKLNDKDRFQKSAEGRVTRLHHKLDVLKFHSTVFKNEEARHELQIRSNAIGTLYNFLIDQSC